MTSCPRSVSEGWPGPLGVTLDATGANVAVWAPDAEEVLLCLFGDSASDVEERIPLPYRSGGIRHAHVKGVGPGTRYGLRATGPFRPEEGLRFDPDKLLVDPYARKIEGPVRWHPVMSAGAGDSAGVVPKCVAVLGAASEEGSDPSRNRPGHRLADLVVYEAHVKGLTAAHPEVPEELRGTYEGLAHPAVIAHLVDLGVTAVELLPVQAFIDDRYVVSRGLTNYWGYQPIAWLAPEPRYARRDADRELRGLVRALHEAGIEVIVDVVYNHTGEGDEHGPVIAYRGLDNRGYYRLGARGAYVDDTGTGNTVAAERPAVLRLMLDSLRHWADRYGVDGFRFDLATAIGRGGGAHGFDPDAAFFQAVAQDPVLSALKLIAEPWDLGPGGYRRGAFPQPWAEWNDRFRDGVRLAWRGDAGGRSELGSLLLGSASVFDRTHRPVTASVNFVSAHDGFTLADAVSYSRRRNEANLEGNRDGSAENHSDNLGAEGPSADPAVAAARARRVRALLATLLVSQGVPMLLAGDEIGNSQGGNNNAYAQDNPIGWVDWSSPDAELLSVVRRLVALRRRLPVLRQTAFLHGGTRLDGHRDIVWRLADGREASEADWSTGLSCIVAELRGAAGDPAGEAMSAAALVILNTGDDFVEVRLPDPGGRDWGLEIDTARLDALGRLAPGSSVRVLAQSVVVLSAGASEDPPTR